MGVDVGVCVSCCVHVVLFGSCVFILVELCFIGLNGLDGFLWNVGALRLEMLHCVYEGLDEWIGCVGCCCRC